MVWRAQQAKDQIERGQSAGKKTNSGGTAGQVLPVPAAHHGQPDVREDTG